MPCPHSNNIGVVSLTHGVKGHNIGVVLLAHEVKGHNIGAWRDLQGHRIKELYAGSIPVQTICTCFAIISVYVHKCAFATQDGG